jgi:DNA-binding response OmpR family regulator
MTYRKTILHVDDDPQLTRLVAHQLRLRGYEVTSLHDPSQTLQVLSEMYHRLVLLDIDMPDTNGLELLRQIKQEYGGSQIIMLTGQVSMQTLLQSYRWGAEYCVFKPVTTIAPLLEVVEAAFRKIDHWWNALEELCRHRNSGEDRTAAAPSQGAATRPATKRGIGRKSDDTRAVAPTAPPLCSGLSGEALQAIAALPIEYD